jgi:deoxyribonuclease-1
MDASYDKYSLSSQNKKLYEAWDKQFPVTKDECTRYQKIKSIQ